MRRPPTVLRLTLPLAVAIAGALGLALATHVAAQEPPAGARVTLTHPLLRPGATVRVWSSDLGRQSRIGTVTRIGEKTLELTLLDAPRPAGRAAGEALVVPLTSLHSLDVYRGEGSPSTRPAWEPRAGVLAGAVVGALVPKMTGRRGGPLGLGSASYAVLGATLGAIGGARLRDQREARVWASVPLTRELALTPGSAIRLVAPAAGLGGRWRAGTLARVAGDTVFFVAAGDSLARAIPTSSIMAAELYLGPRTPAEGARRSAAHGAFIGLLLGPPAGLALAHALSDGVGEDEYITYIAAAATGMVVGPLLGGLIGSSVGARHPGHRWHPIHVRPKAPLRVGVAPAQRGGVRLALSASF
jgi:hypothetical protein